MITTFSSARTFGEHHPAGPSACLSDHVILAVKLRASDTDPVYRRVRWSSARCGRKGLSNRQIDADRLQKLAQHRRRAWLHDDMTIGLVLRPTADAFVGAVGDRAC